MNEQSPTHPEAPKKRPGLSVLALTPELVQLVKSKPENLALFRELSSKIARDPTYLAMLEKEFKGPISPGIEELLKQAPAGEALESHNWGSQLDLPSPKKAAAALLPAAAAIP